MKPWTKPGGNGNGHEETDVAKFLVTDLMFRASIGDGTCSKLEVETMKG